MVNLGGVFHINGETKGPIQSSSSARTSALLEAIQPKIETSETLLVNQPPSNIHEELMHPFAHPSSILFWLIASRGQASPAAGG